MMADAAEITRAFGGDWRGRYGVIPTPGHSKRDRGTRVRDGDNGDVIFDSFNGGDWRAMKDECRRRGLLPPLDRNTPPLSPIEQRRREREAQERARARDAAKRAMWEEVAAEVAALWDQAGEASPRHAYLLAKRIPGEGVRQLGRALVVPMRDAGGRLWNVQRIYADGRKVFGPPGCEPGRGGRIEGLFWLCGDPAGVLCVGEGFATMATVRLATGYAVAAAITAANLEATARALRGMFPALDLVICADDDAALAANPKIRRNLGVEYATAAAIAVGGRLAIPRSNRVTA